MPAVKPTPRVQLRSSSRRVPRVHSARTATVADVDPEPNMRLSRAILVMLLLHVVAVGGIFAFSFIKDRDPNRATANHTAADSGVVEAEETHLPASAASAESSHGKPVAPVPPKPSVHVVRAGETLMHIAYDHGVTPEALVAANGTGTVTNKLRPGQELKLPDKSPEPEKPVPNTADNALALIEGRSSTAANTPATTASTARSSHIPMDAGKIYVVGKGESPFVIAKKLKVSPEVLLKFNQIDDPKKLKPGQKLRVPPSAKTPVGKG